MIFILIVFFLIVIALVTLRILSYRNSQKTFHRLNNLFASKQPIYKELGIYEEALPRIFLGKKKSHGTLFITGYGSTPTEFSSIIPLFKQHNLYYYIPRTVGWGRPFFQPHITWKDWVLCHLEAYLIMSETFEKVSIIGHSTGCNIACILASCFPVHHLILSGPNLIAHDNDLNYKKIFLFPFIKRIFPLVYPVFQKPTREGRFVATDTIYDHFQKKGFFVESLPLKSLQELWELQERGIKGTLKTSSLTLLSGESDKSVGKISDQLELLKKHVPSHIPFNTYTISNAGHNIFEENPEIVGKTFMIIHDILKT